MLTSKCRTGALFGFMAGLVWASPLPPVPAESRTLLVFPPENLTRSSNLDWMGETIALSISQQLQVPDLEVLDRDTRLALIEGADLPHTTPLSLASMIRIAQQSSATLLVIGSYSGTPQSLRIALRLFDLTSLGFGSEITASGAAEDLAAMENDLAWQLLGRLGLEEIFSREEYRARARTIPNSAFSHYVRSLFASEEGSRARLLIRALEIHPEFPEALFLLGRHYFRSSDCAGAIEKLSQVRRRSRSFPEAQFMLGTCHLREGAYLRSVEALRAVLPFTQPIEALNNLGVAYLRLGDWTNALQSLSQARRISRSHPTPAVNQSIAEISRGNPSAAFAVLEEAIRINPGDGRLRFLLGIVHSALGDSARSERAMNEARSLGIDTEKMKSQDPKSWSLWLDTWERIR